MTGHKLVICTANEGYEVSLELRKLYEILPDEVAGKHAQVRVVDESGEGYLYPASYFIPVDLPATVVESVLRAA